MRIQISLAVSTVLAMSAAVAQGEVITLRSGQVGGLPGAVGQADDIVKFLPNNPGGAPISATPFTPGDFAGAVAGPSARVINAHPAWTPGISDPAARWINFGVDLITPPDGTPPTGSGFGLSGSALYAVPFYVNTIGATGGYLNMEFAVDDTGGDLIFGGGNPSFLYVNGMATGYSGGNYATPTTHSQFIPFSQGQNYIYLYQRDAGVVVSGTIFSMTIDVVPAPCSAAVVGLGGLMTVRRRRRA